MILAGDVGAGESRLGLFRRRGRRAEALREEVLPTPEHASAEALLDAFSAKDRPRVRHVALSIADGLPWSLTPRKLEQRLDLPVTLLRPAEATSFGIHTLTPSRLRPLTRGKRGKDGDAALLLVGDDPGMTRLRRNGDRFEPLPGNACRGGFAPRTDLDVALYRSLRRRHGHVGLDRILGRGNLETLYGFLLENGWADTLATDPATVDRAVDRDDAILTAAETGDPLAEKTLEWLAELLGVAAGDLALACDATAGIYLGGSMAPRLLPALQDGGFVEAFADKGQAKTLLDKIPVRVILDPRVALLGAANYAAGLPATRRAGGPRRKK